MSDLVIYRFQPDAMDEDVLRSLCVGKENLLQKMREDIKRAVINKTPRYYLVVGPRGIGKSHFITLLYHDLKMLKGAIPVKLAEEEFSIYRVSDFFSRIFEEINHEKFNYPDDGMPDGITDAVMEYLKSTHNMILLFVENLNQILEDQMGEKDVKKLKSLFQEENIFIVVATSPLVFSAISHKSEPFYNFFDIKNLTEFTKEEVREFIKVIDTLEGVTDTEYYKKIDPIVTLTGGSPRIVILLYDLMRKKCILDIEDAFFKILDEYTSYYQDIFKALTGQKRRILDVLMSIEPATPKEVAEHARLNNKTVITQLRRLEKDGYVVSHKMGNSVKYEVRERLFRLWREQRQPLGRRKLSILIEFIKLWYSSEEREREFLDVLSHLDTDNTLIKKAAYIFWTFSDESKMKVLPDIAQKSHEYGIDIFEAFSESESDKELKRAFEIENLAVLAEEEKYDDFLKELERIIERDKNEVALFLMGIVLLKLNRNEEALQFIDKTLMSNPENAGVWYYRGIALTMLSHYEEALQSFDKALAIDEDSSFWIGKGNASGHLQDFKEALQCFDRAIVVDSRDVDAWMGRGQSLLFLKQYREALTAFEKVLDISPDNQDVQLYKGTAYLNIALQELEKKNFEKGLVYVNSAMDSFLKVWLIHEKEIKKIIIDFFKNLADSKHIEAIDITLKVIIDKKGECAEFLECISKALDIIKTRNLKKYYELHAEKRDIVADLVMNISGSEELLPE